MCFEPATIALAVTAASAAYGVSQMSRQQRPQPSTVTPPTPTADPYKSPESSPEVAAMQVSRRQLKTDLTIPSSSAGLQTRPALTIGGG